MENNWTLFHDMHSGGGCKEPPYEKIYIEAPRKIAERVFQSKFGHNPHRVTCTCCGEDYSLSEYETLEEASAYYRNAIWAGPLKPKDLDKWSMAARSEWLKTHVGRYFENRADIPNDWSADPYNKHKTATPLAEYITHKNVKIVRANEITEADKIAELGGRGYVWDDD